MTRTTTTITAPADGALSIGDTTPDGLLQITDTAWDSNGTMRVTVRELVGERPEHYPVARARRLARRALPYPETITGSRLLRRWWAEGCTHATFAVTRLPR